MENHIQIHGVAPRIQYVANGENTVFEFPFAIFKKDNLEVYLDDILQEESTYTITGEGSSDGGSVTFSSAPTSGTLVTLFRNLSIERTTDFQEGGALRANALNYELDYQIACQQQIADGMNRVMCMPPYAINTDIDLTLPTPAAGKAIVWNNDGTKLENSTVEVNALERTLNGYKTSAETAAQTALTSSQTAVSSAQTATQKAAEAADYAQRINLEAKSANCIIAAPNGVCSYSGTTITAPQGLTILIPNGRNADGSMKNLTVTLSEAKTLSASLNNKLIVYAVVDSSENFYNLISTCSLFNQNEQPTVNTTNAKWYCPKDNLWYSTSDGGTTWSADYLCIVAEYFGDMTNITSFDAYQPVNFLNRANLRDIFDKVTPSYTKPISLSTTTNAWKRAETSGYLMITCSTNNSSSYLYTQLGNSSNYVTYITQINISSRTGTQIFPVNANDYYNIQVQGATIQSVKLLPFRGE